MSSLEAYSSEDAREEADYHRHELSETLDAIGSKLNRTITGAEDRINKPKNFWWRGLTAGAMHARRVLRVSWKQPTWKVAGMSLGITRSVIPLTGKNAGWKYKRRWRRRIRQIYFFERSNRPHRF